MITSLHVIRITGDELEAIVISHLDKIHSPALVVVLKQCNDTLIENFANENICPRCS